jgi:methylated-DNA-[protein]-cysteine S-methyltransferase
MTKALGWTVFPTAIGACGVAWGERGLVGVHLPDGDADTLRRRLARRYPGVSETEPVGETAGAVDGIVALLAGEPTDLSTVPVDLDGIGDFERRVYELARTIPCGETLTYGEVAARLDEREPEAARRVGQALGRNPFAIVVPCHRVVAAAGATGGFSARGGVATKLRLLSIERARRNGMRSLFD